jgi:hypothetical protein
MAELPLARASRRLRVLDPVARRRQLELDELGEIRARLDAIDAKLGGNGAAAPHSGDELDIMPIINAASDEVADFLEFSRCFSFGGADTRALIGPLVYVLLRGNRPLYVGMSTLGARRPFDPGHHALRRIADTDKLLIWPVKNAAMAEAMERELITRLQPAWNRQGRTTAMRQRLGVQRWPS